MAERNLIKFGLVPLLASDQSPDKFMKLQPGSISVIKAYLIDRESNRMDQ